MNRPQQPQQPRGPPTPAAPPNRTSTGWPPTDKTMPVPPTNQYAEERQRSAALAALQQDSVLVMHSLVRDETPTRMRMLILQQLAGGPQAVAIDTPAAAEAAHAGRKAGKS